MIVYDEIQPTPPARRRAEAEAIYQLLRLVAQDAQREAGTLDAAGVVVERFVTGKPGDWQQVVEVRR